MGKLFDNLQKQLNTENKKDAEDCLEIYNHLKSITGSVWESQWNILVDTTFGKFPSNKRTYKPSLIGTTLLIGINNKT